MHSLVDELQRTLVAERSAAQALTNLPFHFLEIAVLLLDRSALLPLFDQNQAYHCAACLHLQRLGRYYPT